MNTIFSIIYLQTNTLSGEKIAVGLIAITETEIFFKVSEQKLKFAAKLISQEDVQHASFNFQLIKKNVSDTNKELGSSKLFKSENIFTKEYLQYLKKYSKGLTLFDEPKAYAGLINKKTFKDLFEKAVGDWEEASDHSKKKGSFTGLINKKLANPVFKEKGDVNYTLTPDKVTGLLLPQEVNLISKKGNILAAHAIDFTTSVETITKHMYELEVLYNSLDNLGQDVISKKHKGSYYLLFNKPEKQSPQENLLNTIFNTKSDFMQVHEIDYLEELATKLEKKGYSKFSALINQ